MPRMLTGSGEPPQTRPVALPAERRKPRTGTTRSNATFQQPLSGSRRSVPSTSMNSTSTSAAAPAGCRPRAEPAPATEHLTIDLDHPCLNPVAALRQMP